MNLTPIASNMTELELKDGVRVLFSYKTPVAMIDMNTEKVYVTEKYWSPTTSRHINKWCGGNSMIKKPQEYFDNLIKAVS